MHWTTTANILLLAATTIASGHHFRRPPAKFQQHSPAPCIDEGVFMENPKGCQFFYYCHNGQPLEANCPGSLWFNLATGICDKPESVSCTLNDLPPPPTESSNSEEDGDGEESGESIEVPSETPVIVTESEPVHCPARDTKELTFLPSMVDCGRYYICYQGRPRRQQCLAGFHWNAATRRCDYPRNAKCAKKREIPVCPRRGQVFFPHPEKCDYFVYCVNGLSSLQQCPFYHHWDVQSNSCRWRSVARCALPQ